MSDRPQCIHSPATPEPPAASWEDAPTFREVFLSYLPLLAAEELRAAGRHLYLAVLEHDLSTPGEGWLLARVRAVVADLRFGAQVLASLAETPIFAGMTQADLDLARQMKVWAGEVVAVVLAVEGAMGEPPEPGVPVQGVEAATIEAAFDAVAADLRRIKRRLRAIAGRAWPDAEDDEGLISQAAVFADQVEELAAEVEATVEEDEEDEEAPS
jgi:hypothetical protein